MSVDEGRPGSAAPPGSGADDRTARSRCGAPAAWRGALRRAGGQASVLRERAAWTRAFGTGRIRLVPADPGWPDGATEDDAAPATTGGNRPAGDRIGTPARPFPHSARGPVRAGEEAPSRPYPRPGRGEGAAAHRRTGSPDPAEAAAPRPGGAPGPAEGYAAASVPRQLTTRDTATDTGAAGKTPPDQGARPGPLPGHRPLPPGTPHRLPAPGRGVIRTGRQDGLAGRALAALTPQSDAVRGRGGAGAADPRVAAMRRLAPGGAGAQDGAGRAVLGDAMDTHAVAAAHPSLTAAWHRGGRAPAACPDPLGASSALAGTAAAISLPTGGSHVQHASSQVSPARSLAARPEPVRHGDPVPDDSPVERRGPPDPDDLADRLNRILCDEARRHGIDV